jgi:hypothetical protein
MGHSFKAVCSPKNQPNLKFEVEALKDGSGLVVDEYISRKISASVEEILTNNLSKTVSNFTIKVGAADGKTDLTDANISIADYLKASPYAGFAIRIVIDQSCLSNVSAEELYNAVNNMFTNLPISSGGMGIYYATNDIVQQIKKYKDDNENVDAGFNNILAKCKTVYSQYDNNKWRISLKNFESKCK